MQSDISLVGISNVVKTHTIPIKPKTIQIVLGSMTLNKTASYFPAWNYEVVFICLKA